MSDKISIGSEYSSPTGEQFQKLVERVQELEDKVGGLKHDNLMLRTYGRLSR